MYEFFVQFRNNAQTPWTTLGVDKCQNGREACHIVGNMQARWDRQMGGPGQFRAKPVHVNVNPH